MKKLENPHERFGFIVEIHLFCQILTFIMRAQVVRFFHLFDYQVFN